MNPSRGVGFSGPTVIKFMFSVSAHYLSIECHAVDLIGSMFRLRRQDKALLERKMDARKIPCQFRLVFQAPEISLFSRSLAVLICFLDLNSLTNLRTLARLP